uniref:Thioredoxin domain-containing protein n=1 Tax=Pyrodinium bahamense TaxID=73915 RepID=A0A7S0BBC5_9DINO
MPVQVHVLSVTSPLAELLGNPTVIHASGQPVTLEEALGDAQYLAVCFSASYCPSCKKFMPALEYAYLQGGLESDKKCKVLLGGGDKTAEAFDAYRGKYPQFLSLGFEETQPLKTVLRDTWKVSTIPHVVLLDCRTAQVIQSNARFLIEGNPRCDGFPWNKEDNHTTIDMTKAASKSGDDTPQQHWTLGARIWKRPRFYQLGHFAKKGSSSMYMDENAVRARAGLLNITSWMAIINIFLWKEMLFLYMLWPIVAWDMLAAAVFGLTPLSPYGLVGTLLAYIFGPAEPHWKPAEPKRFAWVVGFFLVNCCALGGLLQSRPLMIVAVMMCNAATWAESALGFCVGCWMWNTVIAPHIGKQACQECKL